MEYTQQIESLKKRRSRSGKSKKWSESMSPEAQIAMQLALEDTKAMKLEQNMKEKDKKQSVDSRSPTKVAFVDEKSKDGENSENGAKSQPVLSREPSFSELFDRNGSARMRRDMTDESYSEESDPKRALGGGKIESAMEIVEIVNRDKPDETNTLDEHAIDELARINSLDKCAVWIEATQGHQRGALPNIPEAECETREQDS